MGDVKDLQGAPAVGSDKDADLLATMRHHLSIAIGATAENRTFQLADLRGFGANSDNNWLWPEAILKQRAPSNGQAIDARPCLTVNMLPQHVHQITNDFRENCPEGTVIPASDDASSDTAEVFEDKARQIQYESDAQTAYETAFDSIVISGEGYWRIRTDYEDENSFNQKVIVEAIDNLFSVYMDPAIKKSTGADAKWAFITDQRTKKEYETEWPNATSFASLGQLGQGDEGLHYWLNDNSIRIAEYFYVEEEPATLNLYIDGSTAIDKSDEDKELRKTFKDPIKTRKTTKKTVKWIKTNGYEILERGEWPGFCIPLVRVVGNELKVEGRIYTYGIIRNAKDAQRMYNYWKSCQAEMLALAPKAPFIGYEGQFDGHESSWKTANVKNHPYLQVKPVVDRATGQVLPLPQRAAPPMAQPGLIEAQQGALEDIKATTGQYNASLGQESNERTGKAIFAHQHVGDLSSYHYLSNFNRSLKHSTEIIVDLIPKIYDTTGPIKTRKVDGSTKEVVLDPTQEKPVREIKDANGNTLKKVFNLKKAGKHVVEVSIGPAYATKRQEGLAAMTELLQTAPTLWNIIGDLIVKNMDWPGAQEISKRIARSINPALLQDVDDPAMKAAQQQIQQLTQELEQAHQLIVNFPVSIQAREVALKEAKVDIEKFEAITKRIQVEYGLKNPQAGMSAEQISDIAHGTLAAAVHSGDLGGALLDRVDQLTTQGDPSIAQPPVGAHPAPGPVPPPPPGPQNGPQPPQMGA